MRPLALVASLLALSACDYASQSADQLARQQAKAVINGVVADRLPGVNAAPVTDCIVDNATTNEIVTIAGAAVTGVTAATAAQVVAITRRPDTMTCIASNGLGLLTL